MALFTPGRTECVICNNIIEAGDEVAATPEVLDPPLEQYREWNGSPILF